MEYRLPIQSRRGNLLLVSIGFVFLIAGTATLVFALISTWGYAGPTDRAMQLVLLGCAAFGALLVLGGWRNLSAGRSSGRVTA
jgi:phosphoglycerol transferase MdoB-like AlkP superfamily enzyme